MVAEAPRAAVAVEGDAATLMVWFDGGVGPSLFEHAPSAAKLSAITDKRETNLIAVLVDRLRGELGR